jgi:hypothetical protein
VIPFYFADRFSGAVVHLTTDDQHGNRSSCCRTAVLLCSFHKPIKDKMPASVEPMRAFQQITNRALMQRPDLFTQTEFFDQ